MNLKSFTTVILLVLSAGKSVSQNGCSELLRYGIYNEEKKTKETNDYQQATVNSCNELDEAIYKSHSTGGGFHFAGFGISGEYKEEDLRNIKKVYCENSSLIIQNDKKIQEYSRYINGEILSAYNQCMAIDVAKDINLKIVLSDDNLSSIHISLTGLFASPNNAPSLQPLNIDPAIFEINDSDLYKASLNKEKLLRNFVLNLKRKISRFEDVPFTIDNHGNKRKVLSNSSLIVINLENKSLAIKIPEVSYIAEPVYVKSPLIGSIVTSVLDSATFMNHFNKNDEWMLANGQTVPTSAMDYKSLYGNNVPDLRGVFIRGKNYSRNLDDGNPEGDFTNGYQQPDLLKSHWHEFNYGPVIAIGTGPHQERNLTLPVSSTPPTNTTELNATMSTGGTETRPKNVTLSYYVRIRVRDINQ